MPPLLPSLLVSMWVSMGPCERIQKTGKEGNVERRGPLIIQTPLTASFLLPGHLNSIECQKTGGSKKYLSWSQMYENDQTSHYLAFDNKSGTYGLLERSKG